MTKGLPLGKNYWSFLQKCKNLIYLIINILNADWQGTVKMLKKMNLLGFAAVECRPYKLAAAKPF